MTAKLRKDPYKFWMSVIQSYEYIKSSFSNKDSVFGSIIIFLMTGLYQGGHLFSIFDFPVFKEVNTSFSRKIFNTSETNTVTPGQGRNTLI